ncbi:Hypothetical predicted protein [Podarcis lilfordi]|uniref:Sushi domain-containing protein n=1 Tax=Podarcis lilfordi TaxID=74358 RepID=A0AA35P880_9SAUR|nr:Hypothetical predicted protein [Podarcis lilfordi]
MNRLRCIVLLLLWTGCTSQNVCEKPPEVDFGETVRGERTKYRELENARVQYTCSPGYVLEGPKWTTCDGQKWTTPPKCLAPCSITKEQLDAKHLLLFGGRRRSHVIQHNGTLEFLCRERYILRPPSVMKCNDGHMDLPSCISVCGEPPEVDFAETVRSVRTQFQEFESIRAFYKCNPGYVMEGSGWMICNGQNWTEPLKCLAPCRITKNQLDSKQLLLSGGRRHSHLVQHNHTLEFLCRKGYIISAPSVRKCLDGHMDLPSCISG